MRAIREITSRSARALGAGLCGVLVAALVATPVRGYRQGPPADRVGACVIGDTCWAVGCHFSFPEDRTQLPWTLTQVTAPLPTSYVPGRAYDLKLSIDERANPFAAIWGFELAPMLACSLPGGDVLPYDPNRVRRFVDRGLVYLSHRCTCATDDPACCGYVPELEPSLIEWSFQWIAPSRGSSDVTFFMAFNAANWNGTPDGDRITVGQSVVPEDLTCPPQVRDLRVSLQDCIGGGARDLRLDWSRGGPTHRVRSTTDVATAPGDRALWSDAGTSDCLPLDAAPLVFYSVAEDCGSGEEGIH